MTAPYWSSPEGSVVLYLGDCREILPGLGPADLILADPSYEETGLEWDRWADGWLDTAAGTADAMWCFGSMRMHGRRWNEFGAAGWKQSQDVIGTADDGEPVFGDVHTVWEKNTGTGRAVDRFRRVHEHALHWYRGKWRDVHHDTPRVAATAAQIARNGTSARTNSALAHTGAYGMRPGWTETGTRLMRSVIRTPTMRGQAIHPSEKPFALIKPMIEYGCPADGLVVDPFAGSGSTLEAARLSGRRAIGVEAHEPYIEAAAIRLSRLALEATP